MAWLVALLKPIAEWLVTNLLGRLITAIKDYFVEKERKRQEDEEIKRANAEYFRVIADPNSTREERKNAEDKYLNS